MFKCLIFTFGRYFVNSSVVELGQRGYVGMPDIDSSTHDYHKSTECCGEETERWVNFVVLYNLFKNDICSKVKVCE